MAGPVLKACKSCSFVSPRCGGQTSKDWQGFLVVTDFEKSEIAKKMGITSNGRFALKVR